MRCERCNKEIEKYHEVQTERGNIICSSCDCIRLACINNPEYPKTEEDFYKGWSK